MRSNEAIPLPAVPLAQVAVAEALLINLPVPMSALTAENGNNICPLPLTHRSTPYSTYFLPSSILASSGFHSKHLDDDDDDDDDDIPEKIVRCPATEDKFGHQ